jgi:hypothetical protein
MDARAYGLILIADPRTFVYVTRYQQSVRIRVFIETYSFLPYKHQGRESHVAFSGCQYAQVSTA